MNTQVHRISFNSGTQATTLKRATFAITINEKNPIYLHEAYNLRGFLKWWLFQVKNQLLNETSLGKGLGHLSETWSKCLIEEWCSEEPHAAPGSQYHCHLLAMGNTCCPFWNHFTVCQAISEFNAILSQPRIHVFEGPSTAICLCSNYGHQTAVYWLSHLASTRAWAFSIAALVLRNGLSKVKSTWRSSRGATRRCCLPGHLRGSKQQASFKEGGIWRLLFYLLF